MEWTEAGPGARGLEPDEVHLWRFPLAATAGASDTACLSPDEVARADGMQSADARQSFLASQTALRLVLAGYTGTPARQLEFARGIHGKPELTPAAARIRFNTSHSGAWGVLAVARFEVGVDVEQIRPARASDRLAQRFLTDAERDLLRRREPSHGDAAFFMLWSRKEAYLKATGFGLAAPFSTVDSAAPRLPALDEHANPIAGEAPWAVTELFVDDRHPAAVVALADHFSLCCFTLRRTDS